MKHLRWIITLLILPVAAAAAFAQETDPPEGARITSATVSGIDAGRLSAPLREDIDALAGTPLSRRALTDLASRIEADLPDVVVGIRTSTDTDAGARIVFVVARMRDRDRQANANARYLIEAARVRGVSESDLRRSIRDDLDGLAGQPLGSEDVDRVERRLRDALPDHVIRRRTIRASRRGTVELIFEVEPAEWARWLRFEPQEGRLVYHSEQGWGAVLPLSIGSRDLLVTPVVAIDDADVLIEEYSGFGVRVDTRRLGTPRLGASFEWSTFDQTWRDATLDALAATPGIPAPYRNRMTVSPLVRVALTRQLTLGGGVRVTELDALSESDPGRMANAVVASLTFAAHASDTSRSRHEVEAGLDVRAGSAALESDLVYERYLGHAAYAFRHDRHTLLVSGMTGRISGDAPLFERFSLGDSQTLRGWDKYDIAPAGGDRLFHTSVEYRYGGLGLFVDAGSVWNTGTDPKLRVSTGVTYHPGPVFVTVGFPVNTGEFRAVFTMGVRLSGSAVGVRKY